MSQPVPIVTSQNFDAVNNYIDHLSDRNQSTIEFKKANTLAVYMKWLAVLVLAVGIALALMMWAYGSGKKQPDPVIVEPRVIQAPDVKVVIERDVFNNGQKPDAETDPRVKTAVTGAQQRISEIEPGGTLVIDSESVTQSGNSVIDFVIFKYAPFGRGLVDEVVVGMHYPDSLAEVPDRQWCYVTAPDEGGVEIQVNLAGRRLGQTFKNPITTEMAKRVSLSTDELLAAQRLCTFE